MYEPQDIHPQLLSDRVEVAGQLILEAHREVIERAEQYDNGWSLGCRSYTWRCSRIKEAATNGEYSWLGIVDGSLRFIFSITGIPVSMYCGNSESPRPNIISRAIHYPELRQMSLLESTKEDDFNLVWSYAMETGIDGEVISLQFIGITSFGTVVAKQDVPIDMAQVHLVDVTGDEYEPVDLPPVSLELKSEEESGEDSDDSRDEDWDQDNPHSFNADD